MHSIVLAFKCIIPFSTRTNLIYGDSYTHFSNTDIEIRRDCDLPEVTKLIAGRAKIWTHFFLALIPFTPCCCTLIFKRKI